MKLRPGRNLIRIALAFVVVSILTFVWAEIPWIIGVLCGLIAVLAMNDYAELKRQFGQVSVVRSLPVLSGRGVPFDVELKIENVGGQHLSGSVRDLAPAVANPDFLSHEFELSADQTSEVFSGKFKVPIRGQFEFGPCWLRLEAPFGILEGQRAFSETDTIKILPETFSSKEGLEKTSRAEIQLLDKMTKSRQHGVGTDFESLSEFRRGDDIRRIDWRATARAGKPIVRRYQIERHRDVMIILDCGRLMGADTGKGSKLDCAIDAGLMLCRVALESGDQCGIGMFDDQLRGYLPPVSGISSMSAITEMVYDTQPRFRESDFSHLFATLQSRQSKRSLIVVLSDILDTETTTRFRTSLATLARRHVVLFAALKTPLLDQTIKTSIASIDDVSKTAVAYRVLQEREQAIHSIRRSGLNVLDVVPNQLTVPLINQFIELRGQNLL